MAMYSRQVLSLPKMRLLSLKYKDAKLKPSEPCHAGIHWKALTEYFQMSTHVPVFQSFSSFFSILYGLN